MIRLQCLDDKLVGASTNKKRERPWSELDSAPRYEQVETEKTVAMAFQTPAGVGTPRRLEDGFPS